MCTWIMCPCEQALVREVCVCRKACLCCSIVLGTVWLLQKYIYIYILQKKSGTKTCRIIDNRRGPLTNPVKESASKKHEMVMSSTSDICRRTATTATTKGKIDACLRRIYTIIEHEWDEIRDVFLKIERTPWKESTSINRKHPVSYTHLTLPTICSV